MAGGREVLAGALNIIAQHHPRAIGIDIYRDLEVPPGWQGLDRILITHPEIMMDMTFGKIEKGGFPVRPFYDAPTVLV